MAIDAKRRRELLEKTDLGRIALKAKAAEQEAAEFKRETDNDKTSDEVHHEWAANHHSNAMEGIKNKESPEYEFHKYANAHHSEMAQKIATLRRKHYGN